MRITHALSTLLILAGACAGEPQQETASLSIPGSAVTVTIERRAMHSVLAEYHRTLILMHQQEEAGREQLFDDTGGYSRVNVYQLDDSTYRLRDAHSSYTLDINAAVIRSDSSRQAGGTYVGRFDVDDQREWRFIPASEGPELRAELRGG